MGGVGLQVCGDFANFRRTTIEINTKFVLFVIKDAVFTVAPSFVHKKIKPKGH